MSTPDRIRVLVVDDHDMVRRGLGAILKVKADLELVGEASNGREAIRLCEETHPDVILMDLIMPEMDGAAATRAIRQRFPGVQVVALTSFKEKELVRGALEAGAIGYLLKSVSAEELTDAIRAAHAGRSTVAREVAEALVQAERLERLARAIVDAPPDVPSLSGLLSQHAPGLFPESRLEIRISPDKTLLHHPADFPAVPNPVWSWLSTTSDAYCFPPGSSLPWGGEQPASHRLVVAPITSVQSREPIGGIYVLSPQEAAAAEELVPTIKSLAVQIASALYEAQFHVQAQAHQQLTREVAMAGQIQASFLPGAPPALKGWQLSAVVKPAKVTTGDFYDFIPVADGQLGLVIADVSGSGMGAALYMAFCRTLLRTYAAEHHFRPDLVLSSVNRRMLADTRAGLFVSVFYGVLNPTTGILTYSNAGHNPPYLIHARDRDTVLALHRTGMAVGVVEDATWQQQSVYIAPGDVLVLYTDGVTEAQGPDGSLFGTGRLLEVIKGHLGLSALTIRDAILAMLRAFAGDADPVDDISLLVVVRERE